MQANDLPYLPAFEALRLFRSGELSPVELTKAVIAREEAVGGETNAFTFRYFDEALEHARTAEQSYLGKGRPPRALEGIPLAVKDSGHIQGKPTSAGSLLTSDEPRNHTSPINSRILESGAIVHARTATPEFSCAPFTHSRRWGTTTNPWNADCTPGGSSGGAAAALAAGFTTLASGSDIGGSIRIPASCCGVVGYKPPKGRNPVDAPFNLDSYCHTGPLARSVRDIILLQNAMCGPHKEDPTLIEPKLELPLDYPPVTEMKIAWSMDLGFYEVSAEVRANTLAALQVMSELGAVVEEIDLRWRWEHHEAGIVHLKHIFGTSVAAELARASDMTTYARDFAEAGLASTSSDYLNSVSLTAEMGQLFAGVTEGYDLFVCPTTAIPAVAADFDHSRDTLKINGRDVDPFLGWVMTLPFNMLSAHPVLSVPSGFGAGGVPTGIQIVGRPYRDADVIQAGLAFEDAVGGWYNQEHKRPSASKFQSELRAASPVAVQGQDPIGSERRTKICEGI